MEVLAGTELRVGELLALKVGDIEMNERSGQVTVRKGKQSGHRIIPLTRADGIVPLCWVIILDSICAPVLVWSLKRPHGHGGEANSLRNGCCSRYPDAVSTDHLQTSR